MTGTAPEAAPEAAVEGAAPRSLLLTGAEGFVGGHMLALLRRRLPGTALHVARFDVTDARAAAEAVRAARPDAVLHLAAVSAVPEARSAPELAWRVNLGGTLALARAVLAHAPAASLLHAGSADVYGTSFHAGTPLDETAPLAPLNTYAATKAAADLALCALAAEGLRAVRLRPFNHTGPGQDERFVLSAFARQVARVAAGRQEPVLRVGALDARRDFLDVRDVCEAYLACLLRRDALPPGTILNIASGTARRVGDALAALQALAGTQARVEVEAARLRPADIPVACGDAARARALLGWAPCIPWERTLGDVLRHWQAAEPAPP